MDLVRVIIVVHQPHVINVVVVDMQGRGRTNVVWFSIHKFRGQVVDLIARWEAVAGHSKVRALEEAARACPASILHAGCFPGRDVTNVTLQLTRIAEVALT